MYEGAEIDREMSMLLNVSSLHQWDQGSFLPCIESKHRFSSSPIDSSPLVTPLIDAANHLSRLLNRTSSF
jgi:hypothetical protein